MPRTNREQVNPEEVLQEDRSAERAERESAIPIDALEEKTGIGLRDRIKHGFSEGMVKFASWLYEKAGSSKILGGGTFEEKVKEWATRAEIYSSRVLEDGINNAAARDQKNLRELAVYDKEGNLTGGRILEARRAVQTKDGEIAKLSEKYKLLGIEPKEEAFKNLYAEKDALIKKQQQLETQKQQLESQVQQRKERAESYAESRREKVQGMTGELQAKIENNAWEIMTQSKELRRLDDAIANQQTQVAALETSLQGIRNELKGVGGARVEGELRKQYQELLNQGEEKLRAARAELDRSREERNRIQADMDANLKRNTLLKENIAGIEQKYLTEAERTKVAQEKEQKVSDLIRRGEYIQLARLAIANGDFDMLADAVSIIDEKDKGWALEVLPQMPAQYRDKAIKQLLEKHPDIDRAGLIVGMVSDAKLKAELTVPKAAEKAVRDERKVGFGVLYEARPIPGAGQEGDGRARERTAGGAPVLEAEAEPVMTNTEAARRLNKFLREHFGIEAGRIKINLGDGEAPTDALTALSKFRKLMADNYSAYKLPKSSVILHYLEAA